MTHFFLSSTSEHEIKVELKRLNPRKSAGADMISQKNFRLRQTQTKFTQQKYIQVPYQVYMSFLEIQITL